MTRLVAVDVLMATVLMAGGFAAGLTLEHERLAPLVRTIASQRDSLMDVVADCHIERNRLQHQIDTTGVARPSAWIPIKGASRVTLKMIGWDADSVAIVGMRTRP